MVEHLVLNKASINFYIFFLYICTKKIYNKKIEKQIVDVPQGK
jgi:hypothetical protein